MQALPLSLAEALRQSRRVLTAAHVTPDGDAVGSSAALAHIAQSLGADVRILLPGGMPQSFSWLSMPAPVVPDLAALRRQDGWIPDLLVFLDCGEAHRAGPELAALIREKRAPGWEKVRTVNIDHHKSNPDFADINWVDSGRSATGEMVGLLAESLGLPLSGPLGEALYLALTTDTGNFTFANSTAESLSLAARIVAAGLDVAAFTDKAENNWSLERMQLWGRLIGEIRLHADGAVVVGVARRRHLEELGLGKDDLEGFASWLRRLRGTRVSLFVREDGPKLCKISLRSMGGFDARALAAVFGGGGHLAAAGAELEMDVDECLRTVLAEIDKRL